MVADVQSDWMGHQLQYKGEVLFIDVLPLEAEGTAIGADDALLYKLFLLHLLLLLFSHQLLSFLPFLLLLPRLQLLSQTLYLLLQFRYLDHLIPYLFLAFK